MSSHAIGGADKRRRVVVTGVGLTSPIGSSLDAVSHALQRGVHGIRTMPDWSSIKDLQTRLGAPVVGAELDRFSRKQTRTMGRVSLLAAFATDDAIRDAGLSRELLSSGRTGLAYGSTHGSTAAMEQFCRVLFNTSGLTGLSGSSYLKMMSHTCIANLAQCFEIRGRIVPTVSACVSASQGIGYGYEAIRDGAQEIMLCGGAEELHVLHAGVFDIMFATSTRFNDAPDRSPRPFDKARDGLVVGEGAGTLVLEELEHAERRGAKIHAEVIGYGTNCDGTHVTSPSAEGMAGAMQLALEDAQLAPSKIDYVNAHGTATELGDIAESQATLAVLGASTPFSSTKGFTGHTLGACGAIEAIFAIAMMRDGFLAPSRNLEELDPRCAKLDYVMHEARRAAPKVVMSNNFAFGGINTSLILERQS
jgi:3-oxoacyl-[acyl-carrier-protein] synthase II